MALLGAGMTRGAERLPVRSIPKERLITLMRVDVIDQRRALAA